MPTTNLSQPVCQDGYGHIASIRGQAMTAAGAGTAAGTIATSTIGSGTPTLVTTCTDVAGTFTVTGTAATGNLVTVNFWNPWPGIPVVLINAAPATGVASALNPISVTSAGFTVAGTATAVAITVSYWVIWPTAV